MPKKPRVAIYTLTKDRLDYTIRTFDSLSSHTPSRFDHFVVDNGSTDGTREYLKENSDRFARVVFNPDNRGISVAANQALDLIGDGYDYIVKLDNDCDIHSDKWLCSTIDIIEGLGGEALLSPFVRGLRENAGGPPRSGYVEASGHKVGLTDCVGGLVCVAPAAAYAGFRFSEALALHGGQDMTLSAHVARLGWKLGYVEDLFVEHMDGTVGQHLRYPEYFEKAEREATVVYGRSLATSRVLHSYSKLRRRLRRFLGEGRR